jgi:signal transduction histidine kinase
MHNQALYKVFLSQLLFFVIQTVMLFLFLAKVLETPNAELQKLTLSNKELAKYVRCLGNTLIIKLIHKTTKALDLSNNLLRNWDRLQPLQNYAKCQEITRYHNMMLMAINDVNDFYILNKKAPKLETKFLNVFKLINNVVDEAKIIHLNTGIFIESTVSSDLIFTAKLDEYAIKKALDHIIANSVEFYHSYKITISLEALPKHFQIIIKNYGIEMPEDELEKMFKPFFHSSMRKKAEHNFGLGLAIAEKIIKLHGGIIRVENNNIKALVLFIIIPLVC